MPSPAPDRAVVDALLHADAVSASGAAGSGAPLRVHAAISRFAVLYERVRNAVEYRDQHLHRKAAVVRILKRLLILEKDPVAIADRLLRELIGATYFPNATVPESRVAEVAERIRKYQAIQSVRLGSSAHFSWLLGILAAEIEELASPAPRDKALASFLYERLAERIRFEDPSPIAPIDLKLQVYVAAFRSYLKADDDMLGWKLLRAYFPEWLRPGEWIQAPQATAERLVGIERRIRLTLDHPLSPKVRRAVRPWSVAFRLLVQAVESVPEAERPGLLADPDVLDKKLGAAIDAEAESARAKLRRGGVRAMAYLFLTKMFVAVLLEMPLEHIAFGHIDHFALAVNLLFPPILMLIVSLLIKVPGKENTEALKKYAFGLLSAAGPDAPFLRLDRKRSLASRLVFGTVYAGISVAIFGAVVWGLHRIDFTGVSIAIFVFFLCLVSFFAFRLRQNAREAVVVSNAERGTSIVMDLASLPILRAGQWLSRQMGRFNILQFFFDFLFEAPFKMFLSVLEEWFAYLREKKEALH